MWLYQRETQTISSRCWNRFLLSYWIVIWSAVHTPPSCCWASFSGCLHPSLCKQRRAAPPHPPVAVKYSKNGKHQPKLNQANIPFKGAVTWTTSRLFTGTKHIFALLLLRWAAKNLCYRLAFLLWNWQSEDLTKAIRFIFYFPGRQNSKSSERRRESGSVMEID